MHKPPTNAPTKFAFGMEGQHHAEAFLKAKGYKILHRNYRVRTGEIDLVAKHQEYIVFVEVKCRRGGGHGLPRESVGKQKQKQIIKTALYYMVHMGLPDGQDYRFDVVEVMLFRKDQDQDQAMINHIENAFGVGWA